MAAPSVTYTFSNGTTADATQVNQNFTDLVNGVGDGTKDLSVANLTVATALISSGTLAVTSTSTLSGNVTINNSKILTISKTSSQIVLGTTNTTTISATAPSASRIFTIPDAGSDVEFVMAGGTQTVGGAKTFSSAVTINPTTNQIVLGVTNTTTISSTAPAASRTYTIPDAGSNVEFVMAGGTQTVAGAKTFSSAVTINPTSNQIVLGVTNTTTISATAPAASRTYTMPDVLTNANFVMSEGTQTINGAKTFSGTTTTVDIVSSGSINSLNKTTTNYIINGNFDIWQRGTSFTALGTNGFAADRWMVVYSYDGVSDILRSTDVPTVASTAIGSNYSLHVDVTTADSSIGAAQIFKLRQQIEGLIYKDIHAKQVTFSFWVKSTKTGTYCLNLRNNAVDIFYIAEYTVNSSDTWEKKTITITLDSSGTWLFTNGIGLRVEFVLACGSDNQGTAGSWQAGNKEATSNQVNFFDSTSNNFKLSQVQLELGSQATPFKPFGGNFISDLFACYRYAYAPGTQNISGLTGGASVRSVITGVSNIYFTIQLPIEMRTTGSLANKTEATHWQVYTTAGAAQTGFTIAVQTHSLASIYFICSKTTHGITDGILFLISSTTPFIITAEL